MLSRAVCTPEEWQQLVNFQDNGGVTEDEVSQRQAKVDELADDLASIEDELAKMREALDQFEVRYRQLIAGRLATVETLQAELEALRGHDATDARARADEAARVADELTPRERYRSLAKRIHPDRFGHDPKLAQEAEELLKRLTEAWNRRDMEEIDKIEIEVERRFPGDQPPTERIRILDRIYKQLVRQIDGVKAALTDLQTRALWALFQRSEEAREDGRDLLIEQADELDGIAALLQDEIDSMRDSNSQKLQE